MPRELFLQNFITVALPLKQLHILKAWISLNFMLSVPKLKCSLVSGLPPCPDPSVGPPHPQLTSTCHTPKFSKLRCEKCSWGGLTSLPSAWCWLFHTAKPMVSLDIKPCWVRAGGRGVSCAASTPSCLALGTLRRAAISPPLGERRPAAVRP